MVQRRKERKGKVCLVLSGLLVLMAIVLQSRIRVSYQYAGEFRPSGAWYEEARSLGAVPAARKQGAMVGSERVTLYAVDELWQNAYHFTLYEGRCITRRDVEQKNPCIVLSESTARRLFPSGDILGQQVTAEGFSLEVVGLIRDGDTWGEANDAVAFVPLSLGIVLDTLSVSVPKAEAVASAAIWENSFQGTLPGGTFHNLQQMQWVAWLPFYITFLFFLGKGVSWLWRTVKRKASFLWQKSKQDLQTHYLGQVWLPVTARVLLLLLLGMAFLSAMWGFLQLCTLPLPVFPEYVPENLVQLSSWRQTVDALQKRAAAARRYLTWECSRMETVSFLSHTAFLFFMLGIYRKNEKLSFPCDK